MPRKRPTPEEIVGKLRQVDVLAAQGRSIADAVRAIEARQISQQQELLHPLHPLHFLRLPLTGCIPFVAIVADVAVSSGSNSGGRV